MKTTRLRTLSAIGLLFACSLAIAQDAPSGSFTLSTTVNGDGTLTPTLTWSTTPAAISCQASGNSAWDGPKAASGTETLAPFPTTEPQAYALVCSWPDNSQALLTWTPPTENTDGTPLTNLAGYRVHWGRSASVLDSTAQIANPAVTSYSVQDLTLGEWFFGVRAYTTQGAESALSNIVSKTMQPAAEWSQQTGVRVPRAPATTQVE